MDSIGPSGGVTSRTARSSTGDVDKDGEVVGLVSRLRWTAPGMEAAAGFDLDEHLRRVAAAITRHPSVKP